MPYSTTKGLSDVKERTYSRYLKDKKTIERFSEWGRVLASMSSPEGKPEALDDILVLELSYANFAGIISSTFLAEFGAKVIKIEPREGDPARMMTPFGTNVNGTGIPFLMEARNKRYITLDLESEDDRQDFAKLAARADVLIETFAPGELDSLGVGYQQLIEINPRLVYVAISPYGHYTDKAKQLARIPWSELTSQAESGLCSIIGDLLDEPEPYSWPTRAGFYAAAYVTATAATLGSLVALFYRRLSGEGQMVDVASADAFASCVGIPTTMGYIWKRPRMRYGTLDYGLCPYGFFKCKDAYVAIACFRDQDFRAALKVLGRWDLEEEWRSLLDRITDNVDKAKELNSEIEHAVAKFTFAEISKRFEAYSAKAARSNWRGGGLPVTARMMTPKEVLEEEHWKARRAFVEVEDTALGKFLIPCAGKMSETPPRIKWVSCGFGQDDAVVREEYGLAKKAPTPT